MVRTDKGFTLIELMVVVAVLGVVAIIAMPNLNSWLRKSDYREAAQAALGAMHRARDRAINENTPYRVVIDLPGQRFSLQSGSYPGPTWPAPGDAEWTDFTRAVVVRGGAACDLTAETIYDVNYFPNGTTKDGFYEGTADEGRINLCFFAPDDLVTPRFQVAVDSPMTGRAFVRD
ncbi:hypothetical protein JCM30471_01490 [Desulfuromonas carbonis]|uniref:pilus assembly FimT family protein n=1 Tax=Desulfuromonas sp. DDH964 TaxID=1823759 RepID=UPI00078DC951|nr:prepilin-type N-terminal cleavage/methylation domain-containing protein [Desulfuromonas sp. DDH964]AMV71792.1 type II secretion system pseudopilin OxpG [Desulfuromonas sp. DDH964]